MHRCIVCFNSSIKTKVSRPGVHYHGIPKNAYMRRKWLKVLGIDRCHDWQRVCSDHFLKEDYKPGNKRFLLIASAIPQPYDQNGFPSNYATKSKDVETGNNTILQMEQNIIREDHIGNAVNNFESPRPLSRYTRNNEDMKNKNMPDHKLRSGIRCSVKNCLNRHSKNLSFFGYPKDFTLRKMWIEKCGIKKNPSEIVKKNTRVCGTHFEIDCFTNTEIKNRLKPGSVPTLFLDNAPNALPVSTDELPVLIENKAAEQSSKEKQNNEKDTTSMTIDDSSNDSSSITLEPIEKRTSQCILMDVCNTKDLTIDKHSKIVKSSTTVGGTHFEIDCFKNTELKNRLKPGAVPTLLLVNAPNALPVSTDELPVLIDNEAAEQSSKEKQNNEKDNTSMTIDDSSNDSSSITLEPIEKRTSQFILMDVCNTKDLTIDKRSKIVKSSTTVGGTHFEIDCFKNTELKNRLKPGAVPTLLLVNAPNALPVSTDELPVLIDNKAAEQSSKEKQNNEKDTTSMTIDLTIDDLSNDSSSITLEPIEKRTSQCILMDVCNTKDLTIDKHRFIFEMSKEVVLPSLFWNSEHLNAKNATRFYQLDTNDVTVKIVLFFNNLVPSIQIYGKKYEYTTAITTKKELNALLEKVDSIEKCCGRGGFVFEQCLGYFENSLVNMCSGCERLVKDQDLQRMKAKVEAKYKFMEHFDNKFAEKKVHILQLRRAMADM